MERFTAAADLHTWSVGQKQAGMKIGLVPTMGYLHEGHLSLIREARRHCDKVIVSIFVNPTQFAPNEDYDAYPHKEAEDIALCEAEGAAAVFLPTPEEMYPTGASTWVEEVTLAKGYCGAQRPIHFRGVCTVVAKLFNIAAPDVAVFGQKDFQQVAVIRRMVRDLNFPVRIIRAPIIRDEDGLAKSSRNTYLSPDARKSALCLSRALAAAGEAVANGERNATVIESAIRETTTAEGWLPDYVNVVDPETLMPLETICPGASAILLACRKNGLRLIDNILL